MSSAGELFKQKRIKLGISQNKLAEITGIDLATINRVEMGKRKPSIDTAETLCRFLKIPFENVVDDVYGKKVLNLQAMKCYDSRRCFGQINSFGERTKKCFLLTTTYKDGECPFCKPRREFTNGHYYPIGELYKHRY